MAVGDLGGQAGRVKQGSNTEPPATPKGLGAIGDSSAVSQHAYPDCLHRSPLALARRFTASFAADCLAG